MALDIDKLYLASGGGGVVTNEMYNDGTDDRRRAIVPQTWYYDNDEPAATMDGDDYFVTGATSGRDGVNAGLSEGDFVWNIESSTGVVTLHRVTEVNLTTRGVNITTALDLGATPGVPVDD